MRVLTMLSPTMKVLEVTALFMTDKEMLTLDAFTLQQRQLLQSVKNICYPKDIKTLISRQEQ